MMHDTDDTPLSFVVHEYVGVEIHKYVEGRVYERDAEGRWNLEPITEEADLRADEKILVHGLMGELFVMTVKADEYGVLCGMGGMGDKLMAVLEYAKDRRAWVCSGLVNLRCIEKLRLTRT